MLTWNEMQDIQPIAVKMLSNALKKDRIAHAYLLEGAKGTGKKKLSILFVKSLFCKEKTGIEPCNRCVDCKRIDSGNHPDVHKIEPEGQSLKKEQIIHLQKEFVKKGVESERKIYIVEHADKMTTQAANSLLKFLEEPNSLTVAILITENKSKIIPTILSRCQHIHLQMLSPTNFINHLVSNGVKSGLAKVLSEITNQEDEAMELLKDDWFAQAQKLVIKLGEVLCEKSHIGFVMSEDKWLQHFKEKEQFNIGLDLLLLLFKDVLYIKLNEEDKIIFSDYNDLLQKFSLQQSESHIFSQIDAIFNAKKRLDANVAPQMVLEQLVFNFI